MENEYNRINFNNHNNSYNSYNINGNQNGRTNESANANVNVQPEYCLEKILANRKNEFIVDFAFNDIRDDLKFYEILSDDDIKLIIQLNTERERIDKLFFFLIYKYIRCFDDFLRILKEKYDWLACAIQRDLREYTQYSNDDYHEQIRDLRKEIPKHVDYNIHRCGSVSEFIN